MTEDIDELAIIDGRDEQLNEKMRAAISALLYFGSRAGICFVIYNAILDICIVMNPILQYSQKLHDSIGILAVGIFLFLAINGRYLNSAREE